MKEPAKRPDATKPSRNTASTLRARRQKDKDKAVKQAQGQVDAADEMEQDGGVEEAKGTKNPA